MDAQQGKKLRKDGLNMTMFNRRLQFEKGEGKEDGEKIAHPAGPGLEPGTYRCRMEGEI